MVSKFLMLNNDPSIAEKRGKQAKTGARRSSRSEGACSSARQNEKVVKDPHVKYSVQK
jgi:hypothetical protein